MTPYQSLLLALFLIINCVAFVVLWRDKLQARKNGAERIPEGLLFFLATIGGSAGVLLGMFTFRHKTRVWYFLLGIPLAFFQNLALFYLSMRWINKVV